MLSLRKIGSVLSWALVNTEFQIQRRNLLNDTLVAEDELKTRASGERK